MKACEPSGAGQRRRHVGGDDGDTEMCGTERSVDHVQKSQPECSHTAEVGARVSARVCQSASAPGWLVHSHRKRERERGREGERARGREGERGGGREGVSERGTDRVEPRCTQRSSAACCWGPWQSTTSSRGRAWCTVQGSGIRVQNSGCRVHNSGCRVQCAVCRVQGPWCRVWGVRAREHGEERDPVRGDGPARKAGWLVPTLHRALQAGAVVTLPTQSSLSASVLTGETTSTERQHVAVATDWIDGDKPRCGGGGRWGPQGNRHRRDVASPATRGGCQGRAVRESREEKGPSSFSGIRAGRFSKERATQRGNRSGKRTL